MPLALVLGILDIILVVHAAKTGRFYPFAYLILMIPVLGALAYVLVELGPERLGSYAGQKARKRIVSAVNPEGRYRVLTDHLAITDRIANREALNAWRSASSAEAKHHYDEILARPLGEEPVYMLRLARAEFALGRSADTVATRDELRRRWPDYQSAEGHLLYARARGHRAYRRGDRGVQGAGWLLSGHCGAGSLRHAAQPGRPSGRGAARLADLLTHMRRAPRYVRKVQAEWIGMAEKALRG